MHRVGPGPVEAVAGDLLGVVEAALVVALGGGRIIDAVKALAAAREGTRAAAVPTTLSAAEMTWLHRHARGVPEATPRARASIVLNDPALSASQPPPSSPRARRTAWPTRSRRRRPPSRPPSRRCRRARPCA